MHPTPNTVSPAQPAAPLSWREQAVLAYRAPVSEGPRFLPFTAANLPGFADDAIGFFDAETGLDWLASSAQEHRHAAAEAYCKALADLGHSDWRLPTIRELLALVDYGQRNPAVDPAIAHLVKPEWHWSSSPVPGLPDYARVVGFNYGNSHYDHRSGDNRVLACRGGVAPAGVSPGQ